MTFDVSSDDWQAYLKNKIMNNIERYFYMIVFAMYVREVGPKGFPQSFRQGSSRNLRENVGFCKFLLNNFMYQNGRKFAAKFYAQNRDGILERHL